MALPTVLGGLASAAGVALTAASGWLIVQASSQPAVLTLLVAIVAVRTFGLARPVLRYAERVLSHDSALGMLARRRAEVYDALVPLTPGRLGPRRGDVLASVVDDVDSVLDRELRSRMPVRGLVLVAVLAAGTSALLDPADRSGRRRRLCGRRPRPRRRPGRRGSQSAGQHRGPCPPVRTRRRDHPGRRRAGDVAGRRTRHRRRRRGQ